MKKLVLLFFLLINLFADEVQMYGSKLDVFGKGGVVEGIIYSSQSEDETLAFKLGLKNVNLYGNDIEQKETYISLKKEIDLDKSLEIVLQTIKNSSNNGNIYVVNYYKNDEIDYKGSISYSDYDKLHVYQLNLQMNRFLGDSPFYLTSGYYFINVYNDKNYNSLKLKLGYMSGKSDLYLSLLGGDNRYLVEDDKYYSCNFGYTTKYSLKVSYAYQFTRHLILKPSFYFFDIKDDDNIKVYNFALSYKY